MNTPVLVAHDRPDELRATLETNCPETQFEFASDPAQLVVKLRELRPEVVFSIKGAHFPADAHRPIVDFPSVKWVQVGGSGYDHLWPWNRALSVTTCAGVLARYQAETVIGGLICLNGNLHRYRDQQHERVWLPHTFQPLHGKTILIVGLGHIGRCVADIAKSLGMRVLGIRRQPVSYPAVDRLATPDELPSLIPSADVVSLHVRLKDDTVHLIDQQRLLTMKASAILINTSRGGVVDQAALIEALRNGQLGGAYLDVFEEEPLPPDNPLWGLPNVLMTPHAADNVEGWPTQFASFFATNLQHWLARRPLTNLV